MDPLCLSSQQWQFTPAELAKAPTLEYATWDQKRELEMRKVGVGYIRSLCLRLFNLNPARDRRRPVDDSDYGRARNRDYQSLMTAKDVVTTAATFFHRFYMRHSFRAHPSEMVAATCLYLALKVEERQAIKIHAVARAAKAKFDENDKNHEDYYTNTIATMEELVLETLCFDLALEQPLGLLATGATRLHRLSGLPFSTPSQSNGNKTPYSADKGSATPFSGAVPPPGVGKSPYGHVAAGGRTPGSPYAGSEERGGGDGMLQKAVTEAAYHICFETITTPLCVLALPQYIAAASYLLAVSLFFKKHHADALRLIDEVWVEAFGMKLGLNGEEGLEEFRSKVGSTVELIVMYAKRKLMNEGMESVLCKNYKPTPPTPPPRKRTKSPEPVPSTSAPGNAVNGDGPSPKRRKLDDPPTSETANGGGHPVVEETDVPKEAEVQGSAVEPMDVDALELKTEAKVSKQVEKPEGEVPAPQQEEPVMAEESTAMEVDSTPAEQATVVQTQPVGDVSAQVVAEGQAPVVRQEDVVNGPPHPETAKEEPAKEEAGEEKVDVEAAQQVGRFELGQSQAQNRLEAPQEQNIAAVPSVGEPVPPEDTSAATTTTGLVPPPQFPLAPTSSSDPSPSSSKPRPSPLHPESLFASSERIDTPPLAPPPPIAPQHLQEGVPSSPLTPVPPSSTPGVRSPLTPGFPPPPTPTEPRPSGLGLTYDDGEDSELSDLDD